VASMMFLRNKPEAKKDLVVQNSIAVKSKVVTNQQISSDIKYPGRVNSAENVSLAAEVNGRIMQGSVPLKEGQSFTKGQLLVEIFGEDTEASLKASRSNFLRTLSLTLPDINIDFSESYNKWNTYFQIVNINNKLPKLPEIKSESEKVFMASNGVLSEYYNIQKQEITLDKYQIWAPFSGYYKVVNKEVGALASNGVEIAIIVRNDKLEVIVPISVKDAKRVKHGQKFRIISNEKEYIGTLSRIAGFVEESTQSVNIYISYTPESKHELFEGELVSVSFNTTTIQLGTSLPREAVMPDGTVFIVVDNKLKKQAVEIIQQLEDESCVKGLNEGDTVVVESLVNVQNGQEVKLIN
jgi:hypothetical protein